MHPLSILFHEVLIWQILIQVRNWSPGERQAAHYLQEKGLFVPAK